MHNTFNIKQVILDKRYKTNQDAFNRGAICAFDTIKSLIYILEDISANDIKKACDVYIKDIGKIQQ